MTLFRFAYDWQDSLLGLWCEKRNDRLELRVGVLWWMLMIAIAMH